MTDKYARINPELRGQFQSLPIDVKDKILMSGIQVETKEQLEQIAQNFRTTTQ